MENLSIKKVLAKFLNTKMVIESGTSGIWTYRKWSDGTAECWAKISEGSITWSNLWTYAYYSGQIARSFPTNLFVNTPIIMASAESNAGLNYITIITAGTSKSQVQYYITSSRNETRVCYTHIHAIGQWATRETDPENPDYQLLNIDGFVQNQMSKAEVQALIEASGNIFKENDTWIPSNLT